MNLRPARQTDILALQSLLRRSWLTTWAPHLKPETVARFHATDPAGAYAQVRWSDFTVADDGGALRGMFHVEGHHLNAIHLDPDHKRRGIGSLLMDAVERRIASDHDSASLEVLVFNRGAIVFYEQRGWLRSRSYETLETGEPVGTFEMIKQLRT